MPKNIKERLSRLVCPACGNDGSRQPIQLEEAAVMCWVVDTKGPRGPELQDSPELYTALDHKPHGTPFGHSKLDIEWTGGGHYRLVCYDHDRPHYWRPPQFVLEALWEKS